MKIITRERWDKKIGGVLGGLGRYFNIDPTILRLLAILICIFTAVVPLLIAYVIAWALIPIGPAAYIKFNCRRLYRSDKDKKIAGICGGIAKFVSIDSTIIRFSVVAIMIFTGFLPLLITYFVGSLIIPTEP